MMQTEQQFDCRLAFGARGFAAAHAVRQRKAHLSADDPALTCSIAADRSDFFRAKHAHGRVQVRIIFEQHRNRLPFRHALHNPQSGSGRLFQRAFQLPLRDPQGAVQLYGKHLHAVRFVGIDE